MTRVLVLGGTGMLGHAVWRACGERYETWGTVRTPRAEQLAGHLFDAKRTIGRVDATRFDSVERALRLARPDVVVNAIGLVKQAALGTDPVANIALNALFPQRLAKRCRAEGIRLVHISTDCVFSGRRGGYREEDDADADDVYGRSKRLGEPEGQGVLTLRTSFIGRELGTRRGLLEWCLAQPGPRVPGFTQAVFSGLSNLVVADLIARLVDAQPRLSGTFHVSGPPIDKHHLLCLVRDVFRLNLTIEPVPVPCLDRSLDSSRFRAITGFQPPDWPSMVDALARGVPRGPACGA